jgi:hypothetical protein
MMLRRMGTGGSGAHEPSKKQRTRSTRRASKQKGYAEDNPRRNKYASKAPPRGRAEAFLRQNGIYDFEYVKTGEHPHGGQVRVYAAPGYVYNIGRLAGTDRLDLISVRAAKRNPKLKQFRAGRIGPRWRHAGTIPSSKDGLGTDNGGLMGDADYIWLGFSRVPDKLRLYLGSRLAPLEELAYADLPDFLPGRFPQHVMIGMSGVHPRNWKKHSPDWGGPDPDLFDWEKIDPNHPMFTRFGSPYHIENRELQEPGIAHYRVRKYINYRSQDDATSNPGLESDYDPRKWQLSSITNRTYESMLMRKFGAESFRSPDERQLRLDAHAVATQGAKAIEEINRARGIAFGSTMNRGKKHGWVELKSDRWVPSKSTAEKSKLRYEGRYRSSSGLKTLDDLVNGRQSYEEMLAIGRGSGFYRVTEEPTVSGIRYFVWPMPPGQRVPQGYPSLKKADQVASRLERTQNPLVTGVWHVPQCSYTREELAHWMPPASAFGKGYWDM